MHQVLRIIVRKLPPQDPVQGRREEEGNKCHRLFFTIPSYFYHLLVFLKGQGSNPRPWVTLSNPLALPDSEGTVTQESGKPAQLGM